MNTQGEIAFLELQERLSETTVEEEAILRFLLARDFNVEKAEQMLRLDIKWRKDNNIASYLKWIPSPKLLYKHPLQFMGCDYEGSPVIYIPYGRFESRKNVTNAYVESEYIGYHFLETTFHHFHASGNKPVICIADLRGLKMWDAIHLPSLQFYYKMFTLFEQHYPEILKKVYIVNANRFFPCVFQVLKPILSGTTLQKIDVLGTDSKTIVQALLKVMPDSCLPCLLLEDV